MFVAQGDPDRRSAGDGAGARSRPRKVEVRMPSGLAQDSSHRRRQNTRISILVVEENRQLGAVCGVYFIYQ